ncbi:MAG TPA: copper-binding protein [Candidatus Udaeobacter sp.]|nr:copper-binding protein [Candidatus Udaeobacter sp.]
MAFRNLAASLGVLISLLLMLALPSFAAEGAAKPAAGAIETHHPSGWRFTMPAGDPAKGRVVFQKYDCQYCHVVRGEDFPFAGVDYGPELSQMGPLHPLEYFAESVMNPNAVVAKQYRDANGKSTMPTYNDRMTVQELIDLASYLASLRPKGVPQSVSGEGKIVALVPDKGEIVLDHGELKDFMDAMTMGYKVSSPSVLKDLKAGDKVRFTIDTDKRTITKLTKLKP